MHIDGYVAVQATTMLVRANDVAPVTGKAAAAMQCAQTCFDAALRLIRPGKRIGDVAGPLNQIAEMYGCSLVDGVMTHNMKQFVIDGNKCILNRPAPDQKVEDAPIEEFEVYAIDIVVSTGVWIFYPDVPVIWEVTIYISSRSDLHARVILSVFILGLFPYRQRQSLYIKSN